jgi:hypothetical protein
MLSGEGNYAARSSVRPWLRWKIEARSSEDSQKRLFHRYPHPGVFWKRGCKRLKTKEGRMEKRGKRRTRDGKLLEKKEMPQRPAGGTGGTERTAKIWGEEG